MKWYLFWEAIWHRLDTLSINIGLGVNNDQEWLRDFCYHQEEKVVARRWAHYPEQSRQRLIDEWANIKQRRARQ